MKLQKWLFGVFVLCFVLRVAAQQTELPKVSVALQQLFKNAIRSDSITLIVTLKNSDTLSSPGKLRQLFTYPAAHSAVVKVKKNDIIPLLQDKALLFADVYRTPKEELTTGALDLTLNKINLAHQQYPHINGNTILVSVKEQLLDTTDIDIKGRYMNTGMAAAQQTSHAAIMATIIAGGANTSPYAKGAAWGATLTSSSFEFLLPDPDSIYRRFAISVQNHSYGTAIENFYGSDAVAYDLSVWNNPTLVHVFSAGNSGTSAAPTGTYSGLTAANITGSFKMSKNGLSVGHVDSFNVVRPLSSRGPAYDGRVKPELVAFGEDGSSGAAALVSGAAALVQQAYKVQHGNTLPPAALVKAVLINSADDIEEKHVDYRSGFGSLNAAAALRTIADARYFEDTLRHGELKKFAITIPPHATLLKATLVWTDTAAEVNAPKALVNDLDLVVTASAAGQTWLPWILNTQPSSDALALPAYRGRDTLNNVEQVTVENPTPGLYILEVHAATLKTNQQTFSIAYQVDTANTFRWTYPTAVDPLTGGTGHYIRWETNWSEPAELQYTLDGAHWSAIATIDSNQTFQLWQTPDTTHIAQLRMHFQTGADVLSDTFLISKPVSLQVGFHCDDSLLLYWNGNAATKYRLYALGEKYLEPVAETSDSVALFNTTQHASLYYCVAPLVQGKEGFRSYTINYLTQGVDCYFNNFRVALQNTSSSLVTLYLGTTIGINDIVFEKWKAGRFQAFFSIPHAATTSFNITDDSLTQGVNRYRVLLKLNNGKSVYSTTEVVYYFPSNPVLLYPNPAHRNEPIQMLVQESDFYTIQIVDAAGRQVHRQRLDNQLQTFPSVRLPAGLYFIQIVGDDGRRYTQKLVVY